MNAKPLPPQIIYNLASLRQRVAAMLDEVQSRDLNKDAGYPDVLDTGTLRLMYEREGIAQRVVNLYPTESWVEDPIIQVEGTEETTEFEKAWNALVKKWNLFHWLHRVDELSGVGSFGLLLFGLSDGKEFKEPVEGIPEDGMMPDTGPVAQSDLKILYIRAFDEYLCTVAEFESDKKSPRYGQPKTYTIKFTNDGGSMSSQGSRAQDSTEDLTVHWTRVIHVADNRKNSEVFGEPRMKPVYNRLYDLRKTLAGSAEMFWKGGFPGFHLKIDPEVEFGDTEKTKLKADLEDYINTTKRFFSVQGGELQPIAPQVADPSAQVAAQLEAISIALEIPKRIFIGSEAAQLASGQDSKTWNKRLKRRQQKYLTPLLIAPVIERLQFYGALPWVEDYSVEWPDLNETTDNQKAETAAKWMEALSKYISGNVDMIIPPETLLGDYLAYSPEQVKAITKAAEEYALEHEDDDLDDVDENGNSNEGGTEE